MLENVLDLIKIIVLNKKKTQTKTPHHHKRSYPKQKKASVRIWASPLQVSPLLLTELNRNKSRPVSHLSVALSPFSFPLLFLTNFWL